MTSKKYKAYTQARVGLGTSGAGMPTEEWLKFSYSHAAAVDAVRIPWDVKKAEDSIKSLGVNVQTLSSEVTDREEYLLRPDKGRRLSKDSRSNLKSTTSESVLIVASNGLSSMAVDYHLTNFLSEIKSRLNNSGIPIAEDKILLVPDARVGIIDDIGEIIQPTLGLIIIGERPGLSSPDSLGLYLTYRPRKGLTDADRNCISNIRPPHGLSYAEAAFKTIFLIQESIRRKLSGVQLKDETDSKIE
jgi:ethanolamine ammonia-lyase small subunit